MNDAELFARQHASLRAFYRVLAGGSEGGRLLELDGVTAAVSPHVPERSVLNGVVYEPGGALAQSLDRLASAYDEAGVIAWTVWVPPHDRDAARLLDRAGHRLDASPAAMAMELEGLNRLDGALGADVRVEDEADLRDLARLNDLAYGYDGSFERALNELDAGRLNRYVARVDGEPSACVGTLDHDGDCGVYLVATHADHRGRGLAGALMTRALLDARERGCATTSLQATAMGRPLYGRLGYRDLGPFEMWERRRPA